VFRVLCSRGEGGRMGKRWVGMALFWSVSIPCTLLQRQNALRPQNDFITVTQLNIQNTCAEEVLVVRVGEALKVKQK
jgi:hypothetical protein